MLYHQFSQFIFYLLFPSYAHGQGDCGRDPEYEGMRMIIFETYDIDRFERLLLYGEGKRGNNRKCFETSE